MGSGFLRSRSITHADRDGGRKLARLRRGRGQRLPARHAAMHGEGDGARTASLTTHPGHSDRLLQIGALRDLVSSHGIQLGSRERCRCIALTDETASDHIA